MIYLYAEVLANIRQVNLYASLKTCKNEDTRIDIESDKKTITVSHNGENASIYLPTQIRGTAQVDIPTDRGTEISVRLEMSDIKSIPFVADALGNESPWSAKDLGRSTQFRCRACEEPVLINEAALDFKDLPSQHWAEMMDLWHCHRPHNGDPDVAKDAEVAADFKGYGSSSSLEAAPGVAFVDILSFLLVQRDLQNIQISDGEVRCHGCKALLGATVVSAQGVTVYKASLSVKPSHELDWEAYSLQIFIASRLLSLVDSSAAHKFVVHSAEAKPGLLVWIFNPDIHYSTSRRTEPVVRAIKTFYQETDDAENLLDKHQASLEELLLPGPIFESFKSALKQSTELMPESARNFQEWKTGLIDRYEKETSDGIRHFDAVSKTTVMATSEE